MWGTDDFETLDFAHIGSSSNTILARLTTASTSRGELLQLKAIPLEASRAAAACLHAGTNTQRSKNRLPYGVGTRVPRHRQARRLAVLNRELSSSPPWHPTTIRSGQNSSPWAVGCSP